MKRCTSDIQFQCSLIESSTTRLTNVIVMLDLGLVELELVDPAQEFTKIRNTTSSFFTSQITSAFLIRTSSFLLLSRLNHFTRSFLTTASATTLHQLLTTIATSTSQQRMII